MRTITADNGTEFHGYVAIEQATQARFYVATPHHAWERGTNEKEECYVPGDDVALQT